MVEALVARDARVLSGMRDVNEFTAVEGSTTEQVRPVLIELSSRESIDTSLSALGDEPIDVLVNNAGQWTGGLFERSSLDDLYELLQVNVAGLVHLTHALLPAMIARGRGKIVNNASIAGYAYFPGAVVYAATKAAVVAFSEALRRELAESPVGVLHLVTPGVETDMLEEVRRDYESHVDDTSVIDGVEPRDWADQVVRAIEDDDEVLNPTGAERLAKIASRGPAGLLDATFERAFER